jgi:hypothetical protein
MRNHLLRLIAILALLLLALSPLSALAASGSSINISGLEVSPDGEVAIELVDRHRLRSGRCYGHRESIRRGQLF